MRQRRRSFGAGSRREERARLRASISTLISLTCLALAPQLAEEAGAQVIRGVVVDSASQLPLNGVLVLLTDSAQRELQRYMVDSNGEFEFSGLDAGWYSVRAERMGMVADTRERVEVAPGDTVSLKLALRELSIADLVQQVGQVVDLSADRLPREGAVDEGGGAPGAGGQIAFREDGGVIVGQVGEGDDAALESGGQVGLVGVGLAADVDAEGSFVIAGLPEGTYPLTYLRPSLGGLDWDYVLVDADVRLGDTTTVTLEPAHPHRVMAQACGLDQWKPYTGVLEGQVVLPGSGAPAPGIRVVAEWHETRSRDPRDGGGRAMNAVTMTNALGAFRFCGIPTDFTTVEVTAGERTTRVSTSTTMSDDRPVVKITLQLPGG